ncbi:unnamed protein product [Prorocentrum cordatum]|uniref:Beta-glucosidase n=1 Tax=Prorocentrum cordatum TaxID=2364126 RepID=A0ABN9XMU6_9DINO|nr:unnamed protein product [Polarella glacialis]
MARGFAIVASLLLRRSAAFDDDEAYIVSAFQGDANFLWGSATAAAQIEGAWNISGKQASTWDDFCYSIPHRDTTDPDTFSKTCGSIPEGQSGSRWVTLDVTDDFFHTYNGDIDLLSGEYGMNAMRMSMSWPRLMPLNKSSGKHEVNPEGVKFYKDVFAMMKKRGVTPFVTLHHWDVPNDLSWLEDDIVNHFLDFAKLCFNEFPEITNWATVNEPNSICSGGYGAGVFAPGHKSTTDHLVCGHHRHMRDQSITSGNLARRATLELFSITSGHIQIQTVKQTIGQPRTTETIYLVSGLSLSSKPVITHRA